MFTVSIENSEAGSSNQCGGKALGCSKLKCLGYRVPEGYVIKDTAFREFLSQSGLQTEYQETIFALSLESEPAKIEKKCTSFQNSIKNAHLPENIQQAIQNSHNNINGLSAVRSSASVEDSSNYAFAGVFHSELNVSDKALNDVILNCWSSFFDFRVLSEVLRNNIDPDSMGIALLVQQMVPADHAGVLFTMDPTGQDSEAAVLSITHGTAEKLMDGETEGSHFRVNRKTATIIDQESKPEISDKILNELIQAGFKLEKKMGHPQDIEWAVIGDMLYFLQMRPVTTIEIEALRDIVWSRELSEERYPQPISHLGWSIINDLLPLNLKVLANRFGLVARRPDQVAKTIRNYVYGNKNFFTIPGSLRPNPFSQKRLLKELMKESLSIVKHAVPAAFKRGKFGFKWLAVSCYFRAFIFPHAGEILSTWDSHVDETIKDMDAFNQLNISSMSLTELWHHRMQMDTVARQYMEADLAIYVVKMACSWMIERIGNELRGNNHVSFLMDLTSGLENNRTLEMNRDMEIMAEFVRNQPDIKALLAAEKLDEALEMLASVNESLLSDFINKNGHLTTNWDIKEPTWGEDPHKVMQMLRGQILTDTQRSVSDFHKESRQKYLDLRVDVASRLSDTQWMVPFFENVLTYLRQFMRIDEEHHFYCSRLFKPIRELFHEIGNRFVTKKIIENVDDIFFLTLEEIESIINNKSYFTRKYLVKTRRSSFNHSHTISPPETIIGQKAVIDETNGDDLSNETWKGIGGSSGTAEGLVRIVETTEQARDFKDGEIFVTTSPNPAFTPLFAIASGLVSATGSILSHGLVSAREYQLPAVTGIADIAKKLKNGQKVKVDGNTGIVSILSE